MTSTITRPTVADILTQAADLLEEKGWCQDRAEDPDGHLCAVGAMDAALGFAEPYINFCGLFSEAVNALRDHIGAPVTFWNDAPGRTAGEVITAFRDTAEEAATTPDRSMTMTTDLVLFGNALPLPADLPEPVAVRPKHGGVQGLWRFPNGRGASVVRHSGSYGVEMAVLRFTGQGIDDFGLDYSTPVTDDVVGGIGGPNELVGLLRQVRDLPAPDSADVGKASGSGSGGDLFTAVDSLRRMC